MVGDNVVRHHRVRDIEWRGLFHRAVQQGKRPHSEQRMAGPVAGVFGRRSEVTACYAALRYGRFS